MRASIVGVVIAASSLAYAEPAALPVDNVLPGSLLDWTMFSVEQREGTKLVKEEVVDGKPTPLRAIVVVWQSEKDPKVRRVIWFLGGKDSETETYNRRFPTKLNVDLVPGVTSEGADLEVTPATCKLDTSFPCSKVRFTGTTPDDKATPVSVTMTMAKRVVGSGIVDLEITDKAGVVMRMKAIGYGNDKKSAWGAAASKAELTIFPEMKFGFGGRPKGPVTNPTISLGKLAVTGALEPAIVRRRIKGDIQKLIDCYEKALVASPTLAGVVGLTFSVGGDGKVVSSSGTGVDKAVASCMAGALAQLALPAPKDGKPVSVRIDITCQPGATK